MSLPILTRHWAKYLKVGCRVGKRCAAARSTARSSCAGEVLIRRLEEDVRYQRLKYMGREREQLVREFLQARRRRVGVWFCEGLPFSCFRVSVYVYFRVWALPEESGSDGTRVQFESAAVGILRSDAASYSLCRA